MFTVNQCSWRELARVPLDPVLISSLQVLLRLLKFWGQIGFMSSTRDYVGSLPGNTCVAAINRGRRNDSCQTETPAMRRGKLAPSRHRRKGKFWGDGYLFEKPCLVIGSAQHVSITVIYRSPLALIYQHIWLQLDTRYCRQHLYGQTCKNDIISYQWLKVEQKKACLLWESVENSDVALPRMDF